MKEESNGAIGQQFKDSNILAKSDGKSLLQHIEDCLEVYQALCMALPVVPFLAGQKDFFDLLFCAVYLHDWGKAHIEFQKVLKGKKNQWFHNRHEMFSVPFVEMLPFSPDQKDLIAQSVLGHHKDFETLHHDYLYSDKEIKEYHCNFPSRINPLDFRQNLLERMDVAYLLELKARLQYYYDRYASGKRRFHFGHIDFSSQENPIKAHVRRYLLENSGPGEKKYWCQMLLSGATKLCDHMGSAEIKGIPKLTESCFDFLNRLDGKQYTHQRKCSRIVGNVFLMAPTGSGKTEAALMWVRRQLQSGHQGRIFYVLPYTASINAMHRRLIGDFEDKGVKPGSTKYIGILHGRLRQYLADYFEGEDDNSGEVQSRLAKIKEVHRQLVHPLKVVTPFQILKYCYGVKGFDMGFTELAGAMLIFDEIHAYDSQTFAQIAASLSWMVRHLGIRVMIMTATLPSFMLDDLRRAVARSKIIRADDTLLKHFTRHSIHVVDGTIFDQLPGIDEALRRGQRVIVACNTVANAQEVFRRLGGQEKTEESVLLHSRFIAEDRLEKERFLIEEEGKVRLLVGTQAIEVSLDIDFDVMFTEPAPLDALIQRCGRINRKRKKDICPVYVCCEGGQYDHYIYPEKIVANTLRVLNGISIVRERTLQRILDEVYPDWPEKNKYFETKAGFAESLSRLKPFIRHKEDEKAFYDRFTGVNVLPGDFQNVYEERLCRFDFIEAEKLLITLHRGMFYKLFTKGLMEHTAAVIKRGDRLKTLAYWVANCRYDRELGLLEEETSFGETIRAF